jgi:hypothetical protein
MGGVPDTGCHSAAECSNGNPVDGEEVCDPSGVCLPGNPPPTVVSITPSDMTEDVEPQSTVVITFNEALDPDSVKTGIKLLLGETEVPTTPVLSDNDSKVTLTPSVPLALLGDYSIEVTKKVQDAGGAALLDAVTDKFKVRDGAWHEPTLFLGNDIQYLSPTLPMAPNGEVLVAPAVMARDDAASIDRSERVAARCRGKPDRHGDVLRAHQQRGN